MHTMNDFSVMFLGEKKVDLKSVYQNKKNDVDHLVRSWDLDKFAFRNNELMVCELILKLRLIVIMGKRNSETLLIDVVSGVFDRHLESRMGCGDFARLVKKIYRSDYLNGIVRR